MKKRIALLLAIVMLMVPVLSACGGGGNKDAGGNNAPAAEDKKNEMQSVEEANKQQEQAKPEETATYKKHVTIGAAGNLTSIEPHTNANGGNDKITFLYANHLLAFNWETKQIEPELVESWEVEAADSYLFTLRKGIKFSNGEELTTDDVLFTFVDRRELVEGTTLTKIWSGLEELEIIDDYTFRMKLTTPNADWLHNLYTPNACIMNREACMADPEKGHYIGTGGWIIESWSSNEYIHFTRNDDSWVWADGLTPTEEITIKYIAEASARAIALQNGEIDAIESIADADMPALEGDANLETITYPVETLYYYFINMQNGVFANDKELRKAVSYAMNYSDINAYMTKGKGQIATTMFGLNQFGYYDGFEEPVEFNLEKAKEHLAKSSMPNGGKFTIVTTASLESLATLMQAMMKELNIEVTVSTTDNAGFNAAMKDGTYDLAIYNISQRTDGARFAWIADPTNSTNRAHWDYPELNDLMVAATATADEAERLDLYKQAQELINDERVYVPMYHSVGRVGWAKGVSGIKWSPDSKNDYNFVVCAE